MLLLKNLRAMLRMGSTQTDLNDELRFHLEKEIEQNIVRGMSPEEARRRALISFGGVQQTREAVLESGSYSWLRTVLQDARYGWRRLAKSPGFAAIAIAILALGIGGNTAIFTVVNGVLLNPLAFSNATRLVQIQETYANGNGVGTASPANFRDWQTQSTAFAQLVAYTGGNKNLQDGASPERVRAIQASANLFDTLGVRPMLGRILSPADQELANPNVAVISAGLWRRRFGSDVNLVGKTITLDGEACTVVGIMPDDFTFPPGTDQATDIWLPLRLTPQQAAQRGNHWLFVIGLLRPGVSPASATADLKTVAKHLEAQYPEQERRSVRLMPLREYTVGSAGRPLYALLGAVVLVLLIACANLANLLLARTAGRKREIAIRMALGASPGRVRRQFFTESFLLALGGGIAGIVVANAGVKALVMFASREIPRLVEVRLDLSVFVFLLAISVISGLVFGMAPAFESARLSFHENLNTSSVTASTRPVNMRLRNSLVVSELALSLVLLTGAGLLIKTFYNLRNTDPGFVTEHILSMHLSVPEKKYPDQAIVTSFYQPLLEKIKALPGVQSAGIISLLPIQRAWANLAVQVEGHPVEPGHEIWAEYRTVSPDYFTTLGIPLRKGRNFNDADTATAPGVVLINETLAKMCFPSEDPIGKHILFDKPWTIVGIVGSVKQVALEMSPQPELYLPYTMDPALTDSLHGDMTLVVRAAVPPDAVTGSIRNAVLSLDPGQPIFDVKTMQQVIAESISNRQLYMMLLGIFAGTALLLATIGIYGVISFLVAQRTIEFGIRLALGAQPSHLLGWVLRQSLRLVLAGIVLGLACSFAVTRSLSAILYGVTATDTGILIAVSLLLGGVALAATWLPARHATQIDPLMALRNE